MQPILALASFVEFCDNRDYTTTVLTDSDGVPTETRSIGGLLFETEYDATETTLSPVTMRYITLPDAASITGQIVQDFDDGITGTRTISISVIPVPVTATASAPQSSITSIVETSQPADGQPQAPGLEPVEATETLQSEDTGWRLPVLVVLTALGTGLAIWLARYCWKRRRQRRRRGQDSEDTVEEKGGSADLYGERKVELHANHIQVPQELDVGSIREIDGQSIKAMLDGIELAAEMEAVELAAIELPSPMTPESESGCCGSDEQPHAPGSARDAAEVTIKVVLKGSDRLCYANFAGG